MNAVTVSPDVDGAVTRVSRLTAHILLASIARDAGVDMPDGVSFSLRYGQIHLDYQQVDEMGAWVKLLDAGVIKIAVDDQYIHHTTDATDWNGWRLHIACLVPRSQGASVEADVSAVLDSLLADSSPWISVATGEQVPA